jgi:hypothetical protein
MTRLEQIEQDVSKLSDEELAKFREWFAGFDAAAWDSKLADDVKSGKLDRLAQEAIAAAKAGNAREL